MESGPDLSNDKNLKFPEHTSIKNPPDFSNLELNFLTFALQMCLWGGEWLEQLDVYLCQSNVYLAI